MHIAQATERYEQWLRHSLPTVIEADIDFKHQQMAAGVFPFFRATFYRWAERWVKLCPELTVAPKLLGVGDLHVENYGTWRDFEGRLVWGINDFDEATIIPYPADLVRLAASAILAAGENRLSLRTTEACDAIMAGYHAGLNRGEPFVLAEHHAHLRRVATGELRDPVRFWTKYQALPEAALSFYPPESVELVVGALPCATPKADASVRTRRAGLGSLGRPRLVAVAPCCGGLVAREVKALLPSAWDWATGGPAGAIHYPEVLDRAVRCPDPCTTVRQRWLIRRQAPDCVRIELADLPAERDAAALLHSMGYETANIHLGTRDASMAVLDHLADSARSQPGWLAAAAERMVADTRAEWAAWRER